MLSNSIKHVFFDLDHTLWDFDRNSELAFAKLFLKYNIKISLQNFLKIYKPINLSYWKLYQEEKITKQLLRRKRLIETFAKFEKSFSLDWIDNVSQDYIYMLPENNFLMEGAVELLEYLKPNYSLHIITNGFREIQHSKLSGSGIIHYFKTITNSEDAGVKKPNSLIFQHALRISKAIPEESIMIGDSFEADILGAQKMGMKSLFFNYHMIDVDRVTPQISKLTDVKKLL